MNSDRKLVFIVGEPRSGTTWLLWLLARHPSVVASFHASLFHAMKPLRQWWSKEVPYGKTVIGHSGGDGPDQLSESKLTGLLAEDEFAERARPLASYVFDRVASCGADVQVVVEDTPENLEFMPWILKIFPDAYVLHIIRDPRSVFASQRAAAYSWARDERIATHPVRFARSWRHYMELGRKVQAMTARYREVHYETLLSAGVQELQGIFSWLDLPADPALCQAAVDASVVDKIRDKDLPPNFVRRGASDGWRSELSPTDVRTIEYVTGEWMARLGYAPRPAKGKMPFQIRRYDATNRALRRADEVIRRRSVARWLRRVPTLKRILEAAVQAR